VPARGYTGIAAGQGRGVYVMERAAGGGRGGSTLSRFNLKEHASGQAGDNVTPFDLSANGEKMLLRMAAPDGGRGVMWRPTPLPRNT